MNTPTMKIKPNPERFVEIARDPDTGEALKSPRQFLIVRDPVTRKALPEKGATVPRNAFWLRRLNDGDVVDAAAAPRKSEK